MSLKTQLLQTISSHQGDVLACCFSGRLLAIGSGDKLVRLFALEPDGSAFSELPQSPLCAHSYAVNFVQFAPQGTLLASCSQDGRVVLWDVRTGRKTCQFEHESKQSLRVCQFSPDARLLATGSDDETVGLWDVSSKKFVRSFEGHESSVVAVAFSPDGSFLCSGASSGELRFWDARFGHGRHLALVKEAHDLGVTCAQFSPTFGAKGTQPEVGSTVSAYLLATGGTDDLVKLWRVSVTNGSELDVSEYTVLEGHTQNVMCLCFTPSGSLLSTGSGDRTVIIWDPIKGKKLLQLDHHQRYVTCVGFSSDGSLLASGSNDKTVAIWKVLDAAENGEKSLIDLGSEAADREAEEVQAQPVSNWSKEDVALWLATCLQLPQYRESFKGNLVDGQELLQLSDGMLKTSLGVEPLAHRNKILRAVKHLKEQTAASPKGPNGPHEQLPHEYFCPVTHEIMTDPVIASDGYTYERAAITAWIDGGKRTSPMTNAPLHHLELTPNRMLKMLIQKHLNTQEK